MTKPQLPDDRTLDENKFPKLPDVIHAKNEIARKKKKALYPVAPNQRYTLKEISEIYEVTRVIFPWRKHPNLDAKLLQYRKEKKPWGEILRQKEFVILQIGEAQLQRRHSVLLKKAKNSETSTASQASASTSTRAQPPKRKKDQGRAGSRGDGNSRSGGSGEESNTKNSNVKKAKVVEGKGKGKE